MTRLAQLLRERRAQHRHNRETADFLRTQLLFNLLDARNTPAQPVVTVPTQSAKTQTTTTTSDASELYRWQFEQINARLSAIEQRLNGGAPAVRGTTESTVDQSTLETLLRNQRGVGASAQEYQSYHGGVDAYPRSGGRFCGQ